MHTPSTEPRVCTPHRTGERSVVQAYAGLVYTAEEPPPLPIIVPASNPRFYYEGCLRRLRNTSCSRSPATNHAVLKLRMHFCMCSRITSLHKKVKGRRACRTNEVSFCLNTRAVSRIRRALESPTFPSDFSFLRCSVSLSLFSYFFFFRKDKTFTEHGERTRCILFFEPNLAD